MPETNTAPDDSEQLYKTLLGQALAQPAAPPQAPQRDPSFIGLLGSALGGGGTPGVPMSADEKDAAGTRALMNFGINMLANSGYSSQPRTFGQVLAHGLAGAQQSMGQSEAVTAARGAAQQEYGKEQQEQRLARIKEALPILTLMEQARRAKAAQSLLGDNTSIGAAGGPGTPGTTMASAEVPADYMPFYQEASARTGIPVEVLIAQHKQESGFDAGATGKAGEIGIGQILPSTAAAPGFGMAAVDPKALRDPRTNINFAADYLRAHMPKGANPSDPAVIEAALKAYNGGGDPNYVANVRRYLPGTKPAATAAAATPTAPGAPGAPIVPAASAKPPAPVAEGGVAARTGGVDVAGPGAPTTPIAAAGGTVAEQPGNQALINRLSSIGGAEPPASNADAIAAGAVKAGADPVTLASGGGGAVAPPVTPAPVAPPPADATPPPHPDIKAGSGLIRHPGDSFQEYYDKQYMTPKGEDFNPNLTPAEQAVFAAKRAGLEAAKKSIPTLAPDKVPAAVEAWNKQKNDLNAEIAAATQAKAATAATNLTKYNTNQLERIQGRYKDDLAAYNTAAGGELSSSQRIAEKEAELRIASHQKVMDKLDEDHTSAVETQTNLQMMKQLSDAAGEPGVLTNYKELRAWLSKLGLASPADMQKWSAQEALDTATAKLTLGLVKGSGLGRVTDKDLDFLKQGVPQGVAPQQWRDSQFGFLMSLNQRQKEYTELVHQYVSDGEKLPAAQNKALKELGPVFKEMPGGDATVDEQNAWAARTLQRGQYYRGPDGNLRMYGVQIRRAP